MAAALEAVTAAERKRDAHEKIQLGGVVIKAGLRTIDKAVLLGALLEVAALDPDRTGTSTSRRRAVKRSSARPEDELPTLAYVAVAYLMMAAAWSVLFIAWPYLVDQVSPPQRLLVERSWYGVRFAVPALAGFLCLPFIARYRRRPVALAVAVACLACASLASAIELQRVDDQRGDMLMAEALKQSDTYVWYGALFAAAMSLGAGLTVRPRPQAPRRSHSTLHGDASWMPMKQVARLLPETGGIVIGSAIASIAMTWPVSISTRRTPTPGAEAGGHVSSPTT